VPNGIELILADHRRVEELFAAFAETGEAGIIGQVVDALAAHDDAEHAALYPLAGHLLGDAAAIERWAQAHSAVKKQIDFLKMQEGAPLTKAFETLRLLVQAHVEDEEKNLLPALAETATEQQLDGLGARILQAKQRGG
jgi:hemerythrin superfamily protein